MFWWRFGHICMDGCSSAFLQCLVVSPWCGGVRVMFRQCIGHVTGVSTMFCWRICHVLVASRTGSPVSPWCFGGVLVCLGFVSYHVRFSFLAATSNVGFLEKALAERANLRCSMHYREGSDLHWTVWKLSGGTLFVVEIESNVVGRLTTNRRRKKTSNLCLLGPYHYRKL